MFHLSSVARRALLAVASLIVAVSCGDGAGSNGPDVARIEVSPPSLQLLLGESKPLTVRVLDAAGSPVERKLFWSSSNPSIATVSQGGVVTSVAPGTTTVAASAGGVSVTVGVTVAERPVSLVRVTPPASTIKVGASVSLTAEVLDASGAVVPGQAVQWTSASPNVASVSGTGVVTGVAVGSATISAASGGISGTAVVSVELVPVSAVTVSPDTAALLAGQSLQLTATAVDGTGAPLPGRAIAWSTDAPTVANVSSSGFVITVAPGTAIITATSEGMRASARIVVAPVPVASVTILPATATIAINQTAQFVATVSDSTGSPLKGRAVSWSSDAPAIASVNGSGLVTAIASGQARITATSEGKSAVATVTVTAIPVATIVVTPDSSGLVEGDTLRLTAKLYDAQGNVLTGRVVSWIGGASAIASVDGNGLVTATGPGTALIIATCDGARTSAAVTVTAAAVSRVAVTPATGSIVQGQTLQLGATITDSRGRVMAGKVPTWSSSNVAVASVSSTGLVQGVGAGTAAIAATSDGVSGNALVTVTLVPVASVVIAPNTVAVFTGRTVQLTAVVSDAAGNPLSTVGRTVVWSSGTPAVASVGATGVVTGTAPGTASINLTVDGRTGTASVTVTDIPVASVSLAPPTLQLTVGNASQLTATARDAAGNTLTGRTVTWSSADPAIASVSATGLVSALAPGAASVSASVGGVTGQAAVTVTAVPVASVVVAPTTATLVVGQTVQLTATARDSTGATLVGRTATWSSSVPAVATVDATGIVTAVGVGSASITATIDGQTSTAAVVVNAVPIASISVSPPTVTIDEGTTTTLTATSKDANGNVLAGRTLTWSSSNSAVATVSQGGVVSAVAIGTATITAAGPPPAGGGSAVTGQGVVTVAMAPVLSVTLSPSAPSIVAGATVSMSATLYGIVPNVPLSPIGRSVTWTTGNSTIATVSAAGVVTGVSAGTTTVSATAASAGQLVAVTQSVPLTITAPVVIGPARVVLTPIAGTIHVGTIYARQVQAQVYDAQGALLPNEPVTWTTSDASRLAVTPIASTQSAALVAQGSPSAALTLIAKAGSGAGVADTITIATDLVPIATVVAAPPTLTLVQRTTQALTLTVSDSAGNAIGTANGNPLGGRTATWTSADTRIATVDAVGVVTAGTKKGTTVIDAVIGGVGPAKVSVTVQ